MDTVSVIVWLSTCLFIYVDSVPPAACFENFQWGDCGAPPTAVLYYYKPGSRCEVALWRGCLPNPNMFKDEYECVNTCIFTVKAIPEDYHRINENQYSVEEDYGNDTISKLETTPSDDSTATTGAGGGTGATGGAGAGDGATGGAGGDGAATGAAPAETPGTS